MALTIGDNFSYMGAKPLDARLKYDTITAMVSMAASTLYDGIMAYCAEDGKTYQWKSTNTTDPDLGKWREFETGSAQVQADWTQTTDTEPDYIKHKPELGTAAAKDSTNAVTQNSTDLIESGAVYSGLDGKVDKTSVGTASGVAELDANGKVPSSQLPSFVDDVVEAYYDSTTDRFYEEAAFTTVIPPESGKSWVDLATNKSYRWTGSVYVRVDEGVQLGETSDTAYRGDRGKTAYDFSQNPATATPQMDGVGSAGSSGKWSREDHVHPSDTSKTDLGVVAASFDDTATYAIDDRCTYNGKLYRFTSVHTGAWVAGDVTEVTVSDEIDQQTGVAVMRGATNYSDGEQGLAPKPYTTDVGKALFGDGKYHTIYSAASGSTILAVTTDSSLFGRTVTLTDGTHTATQTMGNDGECYFTDVQMFGAVTLSCTDAENNEAKASLNLTYFGTYQCNLTLDFATLHFTSNDIDLVGQTVEIYHNNAKVAETSLRLVSGSLTADVFVEELGEYIAKVPLTSKGLGRAVLTVSALRQTYTSELMLYHIYGWQIDETNSDPSQCVTPYESEYGCENLNFTSAHMDFTNDTFDMGSWTGNEFFFPRPCLLAFNGSVTKYLDPDNLELDVDGNTVDITSASVNGNVMVEFPTVYFKRWQANSKSYCVISNKQLDADFHAYAHHDTAGNVLPYIYLSAFDGSFDGTRLRSLAGKPTSNSGNNGAVNGKIMSMTTRQEEVNYAKANYSGASGEGWYTHHKADRDMVNDLLILLGMSTETQDTFGRGRDTGWSSATSTGMVTTGSMKTKGMFWGENQGAAGVKVFHIENWWGNIWKAYAGDINASGTRKVKMTYGKEDGSNVNGFNFDGANYVTVSGATPAGTTGGYVNKWKYGATGMATYQASGSQTTYLADGLWFTNSQTNYALGGGYSNSGRLGGAFCVHLGAAVGLRSGDFGAGLSYKSLV